MTLKKDNWLKDFVIVGFTQPLFTTYASNRCPKFCNAIGPHIKTEQQVFPPMKMLFW